MIGDSVVIEVAGVAGFGAWVAAHDLVRTATPASCSQSVASPIPGNGSRGWGDAICPDNDQIFGYLSETGPGRLVFGRKSCKQTTVEPVLVAGIRIIVHRKQDSLTNMMLPIFVRANPGFADQYDASHICSSQSSILDLQKHPMQVPAAWPSNTNMAVYHKSSDQSNDTDSFQMFRRAKQAYLKGLLKRP